MSIQSRKRSLNMIILASCAGSLPFLQFQNGFLLAYMSKLGIDSASIIILLSLPATLLFLLTIPSSYLSDWFGKKFIGNIGIATAIIGYITITASGFVSPHLAGFVTGTGCAIYGAGFAMTASGWFALLKPIIPNEIRGRFIGRQRVTWQLFGILATIGMTQAVRMHVSLTTYQFILLLVTCVLASRLYFTIYIPELIKTNNYKLNIRQTFFKVLNIPGYMPFCSYVFLLTMFTGAAPWIFGLVEKDVLSFSEDQIILMGNFLFAGALIGFFLGGKMVDRFGTKSVFLCAHFCFSIILLAFLMRSFIQVDIIVIVSLLTMFFGLVQAASSIAITSEMMGLIPKQNMALSTGLCITLQHGGLALSGLLAGKLIKLKIFNDSWVLMGHTMSNYDAILLLYAMMVLLLVVTLGLVPSVIKHSQLVPQDN